MYPVYGHKCHCPHSHEPDGRYNDNPIFDVSNGMQVTLLDLAMRRASSVEFLSA